MKMYQQLATEHPSYEEDVRWFAERGVQAHYTVRKRSWCFFAIGRKNGPTTVICWCGLGMFVEMLKDRRGTLRQIAAKGGNVAKRKAA
jgi:hypothetical protein